MIQRMVTSALFAGFGAGLLAALLHFAFVQKLILLGEQYESGQLTHFASGSDPAAAGHDGMAAANSVEPTAAPDTAVVAAAPDPHAAHHAAGAEPSDTSRNALTALFSVVVYVAYALILVAGFGLADHYGKRITAREGLLWGLAGFAAFQLMPAMGLAPELPGTIAAELHLRQIWWWSTAGATMAALALIGYGRGILPIIVSVALLAAPHIIGAPEAEQFWGVAPPELAASFAARVLGDGLAVWAVLGWLAGWFWSAKTT
jgi:cobalt transporter subunit CbtA